jgi:predicted nucleotidyltransferase
VDVVETVTALLYQHPAVTNVELVGSRGRGTATALSDRDFRVDSDNVDQQLRQHGVL